MVTIETARFATGAPKAQATALDRARVMARARLRSGFATLLPQDPQPKGLRLSALVQSGALSLQNLPQATQIATDRAELQVEQLLSRRLVAPGPLYRQLAREYGFGLADLAESADVRLIDRLGALTCLTEMLLPWREVGGKTLVVVASPESFHRNLARLTQVFGAVLPALAPAAEIEAKIRTARGPELARRAETRVAEALSCRGFPRLFSAGEAQALLVGLALAVLGLPLLLVPVTMIALASLALMLGLKVAALLASLRVRPAHPAPAAQLAGPGRAPLPVVSILVALYREATIAPRLIRRLSQLGYPKELLDIVLVVEEDDQLTRRALQTAVLPSWMRIVVAPEGRVKTKPRALNYALDFCRGSIIGVYDAEDAPEPDQIERVVAGFAQASPQTVCLQGALDFYNPRSNWLSRCFTLEYAGWFRTMLPGLERLGLPLPLGGTTLFFRRAALEDLGGWDAWNVTEDADLGIRLARAGYRTAILPSTTYEEANCRPLPWIKQRSRWIKGYIMTYLTHMRRPLVTWRALGTWQFLGFQVLFLGSILQGILAPVLWSWWLIGLGLGHPLDVWLGPSMLGAGCTLFLASEVVNAAIGLLGLKRARQRISPLWLLTLPLYYPLQSFAAWKALWEVLHLPFYWDKTSHGHYDGLA